MTQSDEFLPRLLIHIELPAWFAFHPTTISPQFTILLDSTCTQISQGRELFPVWSGLLPSKKSTPIQHDSSFPLWNPSSIFPRDMVQECHGPSLCVRREKAPFLNFFDFFLGYTHLTGYSFHSLVIFEFYGCRTNQLRSICSYYCKHGSQGEKV